MAVLIEQLNQSSAPWAEAMWAIAWQSLILIGLVAAACWMLRWQSPALRHWLWLILAAKLLVLPFWRMELPAPAWLGSPPAIATAPATIEAASALPTAATAATSAASSVPATSSALLPSPANDAILPAVTWTTWLLLTWLGVVLFEVFRVGVQYLRLRRLLNASRTAEPYVRKLVGQCVRSIGLAQPPDVRHVSVDGSPMVCGMFKPVLLLPEKLAADIDSDALRQIVFHELAHLKRRDLLTVWILHAMRTVYWFHPAVHWVGYRAGLDRELACDHLALMHSGVSVAAYAHTLIDAAGRATQPMVLNAAVAAGLDGGTPVLNQQSTGRES
jgi:bla regulator protein blaR1